MPPKFFSYKINKKVYIAKDVILLNLAPQTGKVFDFKPGQFVMLALYGKDGKIWQQRAFSICSSPSNKNYIQLAIKIYGEFTKKVDKIKKGGKVGISGPYGLFIFNETEMDNVVFLAGGIGVTPFISAIRYARDKQLNNKLTLLYSNKTRQDTSFYEELKNIELENKNFKAIFSLTKKCPNIWEGEKCRINNDIIKKCCSPFKNKYFFLCGPKGFISAMKQCLSELDVDKKYIKTESW